MRSSKHNMMSENIDIGVLPDKSPITVKPFVRQNEKTPKVDPFEDSPDLDGGWAWIIMIAAFVSSCIASGVFYTFSIYYVILLEVFGSSRSVTAWVGSLNNAFFMLAGPVASYSIRRCGLRKTVMLGGFIALVGYILSSLAPDLTTLFITYGVIAAFGCCLNYTGWVVALSTYFRHRHSLAFSVSSSGVGLGIFVFGPIFQSIIAEYGWRGSFLINGSLCFHFTLLGALIFPPRSRRSLPNTVRDPASEKLMQPRSLSQDEVPKDILTTAMIFKDARAWMLNIGSFFYLAATITIYVLLQDYARTLELQTYFMYTLSAMGAGDLLGRFSCGFIVELLHVSPIYFFAVSNFACALAIISFLFTTSGIMLVIQGFIFSTFYGFLCILLALAPASMYGNHNLNLIFGYNLFFCGVGTLIGPPIGGLLVDLTSTYTSAIIFSAISQFLAAGATFTCFLLQKKYVHSPSVL